MDPVSRAAELEGVAARTDLHTQALTDQAQMFIERATEAGQMATVIGFQSDHNLFGI